jgi:hypothetical protein
VWDTHTVESTQDSFFQRTHVPMNILIVTSQIQYWIDHQLSRTMVCDLASAVHVNDWDISLVAALLFSCADFLLLDLELGEELSHSSMV